MTANPNITVGLADVPWRCRRARAVLLGPLTLHDIDAASFLHQRRGEARGMHTSKGRATLPPPLQPPRACLVVCAFLLTLLTSAATLPPAAHAHTVPLARLLSPRPLVGLIGQGFQRALGPQGEVMPLDAPSQQLLVR